MKKLITIILMLSMLLSSVPAMAFSGSGTASNPYLISSPEDIARIHDDLSGYYKLTNNIDMKGVEFTPIGNEFEGAFTGTIDGNGYTISNLDMYLPDNKYVGFVGYLEEGTIKNLTISNANAYGYKYVGVIAGRIESNSSVENCSSSGSANGKEQISSVFVGGVVGYNYNANIVDCINKTQILSGYIYCVGGVVAYNDYGNVINCVNEREITVDGVGAIGGIVGRNNYGNIELCINNSNIKSSNHASSYRHGGIAGETIGGTIYQCENRKTISSISTYCGGIVGYIDTAGIILNCINNGNVIGEQYVGGITGFLRSGKIKNSVNNNSITSIISSNNRVGGIAGYLRAGTISNCCNYGVVSGIEGVAGGIASMNEGSINNSVNKGTVSGSSAYDITYAAANIKTIQLLSTIINVSEKAVLSIKLYEYDCDLIWTSADTTIATVNSDGMVTGINAGTTTITATTELGISTSALVTVTAPITELTLNKTATNIEIGFTEKLIANTTPANSTDTISWSTSNANCATVDNGVVTAVSKGTATITATSTSGKSAYCLVTVTEAAIPVLSVTLSKDSSVLSLADKLQLDAEVLPETATNKDISWSSSNEDVVNVSNTGVVTAVGMGSAIITATSVNGHTDTCEVQVISASGASFSANANKVCAGEVTDYTVSIVKNPGVAAYKLNLEYDESILEPIEIVANTDIGGTFSTNLDTADRDVLSVLWYANEDYSENSELFTVRFKVADSAQNGTSIPVTLNYEAGDITNTVHDNLAFYINNTSIVVDEPIMGDIYEDGSINVHDVLMLSRQLVTLETFNSRQEKAADVIADGIIDIKDIVRLAQMVLNPDIMNISAFSLMALKEPATPTVKVDTVKANVQNEAIIPVRISEETDIAGFRFEIDYNPDELEIVSIEPSEQLADGDFISNLSNQQEGLYVKWHSTKDTTVSDILFTVRVKYKDGFTGTKAKLSIVPADNNICNIIPENIVAEYVDGYLVTKDYLAEDKTIDTNTFTANLYFDNTFKDQTATALVAFYDDHSRLIQLKNADIKVTSGKVFVSIPIENKAYHTYKLMIWDGMNSLRPLVSPSTGEAK